MIIRTRWTYRLRVEGYSQLEFQRQPDDRMWLVGFDVTDGIRSRVFGINYPIDVFDRLADEMVRLVDETNLCHWLPVDPQGFDAVFDVDPQSGRIRVVGNVVDGNQVRHPMFGAMYARADIAAAAEALKAETVEALARSGG
ncbi:hypothetical protein [Nocardia aurea]|uniref:hypothetical protein n=1 Tax=Nocardia aurea TaxID=2144174 RepID=UPI0033A26695